MSLQDRMEIKDSSHVTITSKEDQEVKDSIKKEFHIAIKKNKRNHNDKESW